MTIGDKTLHEFASNGDGTFNGAKVAQWLVEAVSGKPMSEEEAQALITEAKRRHKAKMEASK